MNIYYKDENNQEILLSNTNQQIMMEWEKPYMEASIDILKPTGDVLEIGFGLGYSANAIQKYDINMHTIIETDFFISIIIFLFFAKPLIAASRSMI